MCPHLDLTPSAARGPSLATIAVSNLKKKYYYPQIETYHYRCSSNLIYGSAQPIQIPTAGRPSS